MLDALADHVELALEGLRIGDARRPPDEDLLEAGLDGGGAGTDRRIVRGHHTPAEEGLAFLGDDGLEHAAAARGLGGIPREEYEARAVVAGSRQGGSERRALTGEE